MKHNFQGQVSKAECVRTKQNMCIFIRSIETLFSGLSGKQKYKIFIGALIKKKKKLYPKSHIYLTAHTRLPATEVEHLKWEAQI